MRKLCLLFLLIGTYCYAGEKRCTVDSPDGKIQLAIIQTDAGELTYQLSVKRKQVIEASALGFKTEDGVSFPSQGWKMGKVIRNKVNSVWKPLWGKRAVVPDKYNEMKLSFVNEAESSDALEIVACCLKGRILHWNLPLLILQATIPRGIIMEKGIISVRND